MPFCSRSFGSFVEKVLSQSVFDNAFGQFYVLELLDGRAIEKL